MAGFRFDQSVMDAVRKTGGDPEAIRRSDTSTMFTPLSDEERRALDAAETFGSPPNAVKAPEPTPPRSLPPATRAEEEAAMSTPPAEEPAGQSVGYEVPGITDEEPSPAQAAEPAEVYANPGAEAPAPPAEAPAPPAESAPAPSTPAAVKRQAAGAKAPAGPAMPSDGPQYFNRKAGSGTLQNNLEAEQNRTLDAAQALGDKEHGGQIRADAAARQSEKYTELEGIQQGHRADAEAAVELNREQKQQLEQRLFAKVDQLSEQIRNPPKDTMRTVLGIVGIAMAAAGNSRGASVTQAIGQAISSKMQKWEAGIAADQEELKQLHGLFNMQNPDSESELRAAAQMSQLAVAQFDSALKSISADAQSAEAQAAGEMVRSQLLQQYGRQQLQLISQMHAKRRQDEMYRVLRSARSPQEAAALTASMGKEGQAALRDITKTDQDAVGVDKTAAEVVKTRAEAAKTVAEAAGTNAEVEAGDVAPGGYEFDPAGQGRWQSQEKAVRAKFVEGAAKIPQLAQNLKDYAALVKENGTENLPTQAKAKMQALHSQILSGVKDAASLGALDNGVIELVEREIGDPTAWNMGLGNVWEQADLRAETTLKSILSDHAAKTRTVGLKPAAGATGANVRPVGEAGASTGAGETVRMVHTGTKQRVNVHPSKAARARAMGFTEDEE